MFSYICKVCGENIKASSSSGERCQLFLLIDGKIVERMSGQYNAKGSVFNNNSESSLNWEYDNWDKLVDLHFSDNPNNGFAAYHERCYRNQRPTTRSENDKFRSSGNFKITDDYSCTQYVDSEAKKENFQKDNVEESLDRMRDLARKIL